MEDRMAGEEGNKTLMIIIHTVNRPVGCSGKNGELMPSPKRNCNI
jgi:hypothetical protein